MYTRILCVLLRYLIDSGLDSLVTAPLSFIAHSIIEVYIWRGVLLHVDSIGKRVLGLSGYLRGAFYDTFDFYNYGGGFFRFFEESIFLRTNFHVQKYKRIFIKP